MNWGIVYFDEWIDGMGVVEFEGLKDLMVTDQLKCRVNQVKDHFIDEWADIKEATILAHKLDAYETTWGIIKRPNEEKFSALRENEMHPLAREIKVKRERTRGLEKQEEVKKRRCKF